MKKNRTQTVALAGAVIVMVALLVAYDLSSVPAPERAIGSGTRVSQSKSLAALRNRTSNTPARHPASAAPMPPPGSPLSTNFISLVQSAASGDSRAAMRLFSDLKKCSDREVQLRKVNLLSHANGNGQIAVATKNALDELDGSDAMCHGVSQEQLDQRSEYLRRAAQEGDPEAMVCYAASTLEVGPKYLSDQWFDYVDRWQDEAIGFAQRAFAAGQADVIPLLIDAYSPERDDGLKVYQFSELVEPNQQMAYAMSLLYQKLVPPRYMEQASQQLTTLSAGLSAEQMRAAQSYVDRVWPLFAGNAGHDGNVYPCADVIYHPI